MFILRDIIRVIKYRNFMRGLTNFSKINARKK